jgi:hypothetical protein
MRSVCQFNKMRCTDNVCSVWVIYSTHLCRTFQQVLGDMAARQAVLMGAAMVVMLHAFVLVAGDLRRHVLPA